MRLLKVYAILTLLTCIVFLILEFKGGENDNRVNNNTETTNQEIISQDKWAETIIGKWKFEGEKKSPSVIHSFSGVVEYFSDSSFIEILDYYKYESALVNRVKKSKEYLRIQAGVKIEGRTLFNSSKQYGWSHRTKENKCNPRIIFQKGKSSPNKICNVFYYRSYSFKDLAKVITFTNDKIVIKQKVFGMADTYDLFTYTRIAD